MMTIVVHYLYAVSHGKEGRSEHISRTVPRVIDQAALPTPSPALKAGIRVHISTAFTLLPSRGTERVRLTDSNINVCVSKRSLSWSNGERFKNKKSRNIFSFKSLL